MDRHRRGSRLRSAASVDLISHKLRTVDGMFRSRARSCECPPSRCSRDRRCGPALQNTTVLPKCARAAIPFLLLRQRKRRKTTVVRQYSDSRANRVANTPATKRNGGPATTFTTRLHTALTLMTASGQVRAGKLIPHCPVAEGISAGMKDTDAAAASWLRRGRCAAGHGRCSCALLYGPEGDCGRAARRGTTAGATPNRRSAREWQAHDASIDRAGQDDKSEASTTMSSSCASANITAAG